MLLFFILNTERISTWGWKWTFLESVKNIISIHVVHLETIKSWEKIITLKEVVNIESPWKKLLEAMLSTGQLTIDIYIIFMIMFIKYLKLRENQWTKIIAEAGFSATGKQIF